MEKSINIFNINIFSIYYYNRFGWFRIFGRGLKFKDTSIHGLTFSERVKPKLHKYIKINNWRIAIL